MAINKNHEFEELQGVKCAIVERNVTAERASFLKTLLEYNQFEVVVAPAPPPKGAAPTADEEVATPTPELFVIGVTQLAFNATNAVFGRLLRTPDGQIVTQAYWLQKEAINRDDIPYYEKTL